MRFLAAMLVVFYHLAFCSWLTTEREAGSLFNAMATFPETVSFTWFGWVGVEIFFVVSGLVIANSASSAPTALSFLRHRAERLYPAVWICAPITLMIVTAYQLDKTGNVVTRLWHSLALIPHGPWAEGVYWTLAVEMIFYILVFLVIAYRKHATLNGLAIVLGVWSSAYILYTAAAHLLKLPSVPSDFDRPLLLRYGVNFAVGMLLSDSAQSAGPRNRVWLAAFTTMSMAGIFLNAGHFAEVARAAGGSASRATPMVLWLFAMALIMLSRRYHERVSLLPPAVLRALRSLGLATYPLYLVHPVLGAWFVRLALLAHASRWVALLTAVALLVCVALIIVKFVEPRVRRLLHRAIDSLGGGTVSSVQKSGSGA